MHTRSLRSFSSSVLGVPRGFIWNFCRSFLKGSSIFPRKYHEITSRSFPGVSSRGCTKASPKVSYEILPRFHSEDCRTITRDSSGNIQEFSQEVGGPRVYSEVRLRISRNFTGIFSKAYFSQIFQEFP